MIKTIIILNGPPHCGKDTAANFITKMYNASHVKFSAPLKKIFDPVFLVGSGTALKMINEGRDNPQPLLFGKTPREVQIRFYKDFLVPNFGEDILGHLFNRQVNTNLSPITVSSDGKPEDIEPVITHFGKNHVKVIQISRPGTNYGDFGDYRGEIDAEQFGIEKQHIDNKFEMDLFEAQIERTLARWGIHPR